MPTWIALLRGINVGGNNKLPMDALVDVLMTLDLKNVRTYIQSGNAVFQCSKKRAAGLDQAITAAIEQRHGFRPQVLVLSDQAWQAARQANPFPDSVAIPKTLHLFFLAESPAAPDIAGLEARKSPTERFHLSDRVFYLYAPDGIGRSKLAANAEKLLGVATTARNWRTVEKIASMVESS